MTPALASAGLRSVERNVLCPSRKTLAAVELQAEQSDFYGDTRQPLDGSARTSIAFSAAEDPPSQRLQQSVNCSDALETMNALHERQQIGLSERTKGNGECGKNRVDLSAIDPAAFLLLEPLLKFKPALGNSCRNLASAVLVPSA